MSGLLNDISTDSCLAEYYRFIPAHHPRPLSENE